MSKILWNTLKLGPAILGASLLVGGSTLAAQTADAQMASEPIAATNQVTDLLKPADQSQPAQQTTIQELAEPEVSSIPVLANGTPAQETPVAEAEPVSPKPVVADNAIAQQTPAAAPTSQNNEVLEQLNQYSNQSGAANSLDQVTNVSQLSDVEPTDWAYEALRSLVERYGCIAGYPDGTYRGNRALSRYEFAAGLNACLLQIEKLIAASTADFVTKEDLATLQRLIDEFGAELATLRTRVDNLEGRTAFLESHQFSTTTKLSGEAIFAIADAFGDERAEASGSTAASRDLDVETIFADRVRLNFDSSFTGKDRLRIRLQARNITPFNRNITAGVRGAGDTGTNMTRLGFDGNEGNNVELDDVFYRFSLTDRVRIHLAANSFEPRDFIDVVSPVVSSGGGAVSRFGRLNPILRIPDDSSGIGIDFKFSDALTLSGGYLVPTGVASNPAEKNGLFDGSYAAFGHLVFNASDAFKLGLSYVRSYSSGSGVNLTGSTGSDYARRPFGNVATSGNSFGAEASFRFSPGLILAGWVGYTNAILEDGPAVANVSRGDDADIWNYAVTLALPDFGKKGNLLGFVAGVPPRAAGNPLATRRDRDTSYHFEGFYRYQVTENISLTPGLFVILNPEHNDNNETIYVGTLRTTFEF